MTQLRNPPASPSVRPSAAPLPESARLDLAHRMFESIKQGEDLRRFKIERLKSFIQSEQYENDLKLSIAIDRLLEKAILEPA